MGYLLPDLGAIEGTVCVNLVLPDNPEILRAFWGQLYGLTQFWNWGAENDEDTREAARPVAEYMRNVYASNRDANIEYVCGDDPDDPDNDAPYWEDAETAAGEGEGTQWGYIGDWAITAFLATAGSPGAALFYKTLAPKARLAFKTADLNGIAEILVDGIIAFVLNTATDVPGVEEIVEVVIDLVDFASANSLPPGERTITIREAA